MVATRALLDLFGEASGLVCNLNKCVIAPIACSDVDVPSMVEPFPCQLVGSYLGLRLSLTALRKCDIQAFIDKIAQHLSTRRTLILVQSVTLVLIKTVLTAILCIT